MSEMKTLKFPGDTEPREIVDAKAREDISGKQDKSTLEADVAAKGFTKNTGTYSKPAGGIPHAALAAAVQTSLGKADTALQTHQSLAAYRKAAEQDVIDNRKQDKLIAGEGITIAADGKTISSSGYVDEKVAALQSKSIIDSGGYFHTDTVEGALQEIGAELADLNTLLGSGIRISFTIDDEPFSVVSGTTFTEWIGTSRVVSGTSGLTLYVYNDGIVFTDEAGVNALGLAGSFVHGSDTIISGAAYTIISYGG